MADLLFVTWDGGGNVPPAVGGLAHHRSAVVRRGDVASVLAFFNTFHEGMEPGEPTVPGTLPPAEEPATAVDVEVATLFANCEKVGFEGSAKITPWASAFARYTHCNSNGHVTVNVGLMYGGGGAGFESSFYLTQDRTGKVIGFGWQVGPEMSVGKRVTLNTYEDKAQISLMNVFSDE